MNSKQYAELLKRPEWKARRLEILARDKNTCQSCNATKYLQVHHLKYLKDKMPWESPNEDLITLCRSCHTNEHKKPVKKLKSPEKDVEFCDLLKRLAILLKLNNYDIPGNKITVEANRMWGKSTNPTTKKFTIEITITT